MQSTRALAFGASLARYAPKYPRPRPGTSERPPYRAGDPLNSNPKAVVTKLEDAELTFIHRPPPSAPTPFSLTTAPASPLLIPKAAAESSTATLLPPSIRPVNPKEEVTRMSDEDVVRLKELRRTDPFKYSRAKLAEMFNCTTAFVGMVAPLRKSQCKATHKVLQATHQRARDGWSEKHSIVKAIRTKRRELW